MKPLHTIMLALFLTSAAIASDLPGVTYYGLNVRFALREERVYVTATLGIRNGTTHPFEKLSFLLYRLFKVSQVTNVANVPLTFSERVVRFSDEPTLQATQIITELDSPLAPNDSLTLRIAYEGYMYGYPEVMAYVRDRIDETYSLLRPDALAFPTLADPTFTSVLAASDTKFSYDISAIVPAGYVAACGGTLVQRSQYADSSLYTYHSKIPTWRIDLAVARFSVLQDASDQIMIYYLPEDSIGAERVLSASTRAIGFYKTSFGLPEQYQGYTIIEIPDGWGSQASDFYFLQTAAAFKDSTKLGELYHEIGHSWNATPAKDIQRCRYFDEAFASFFECLCLRALRGEAAFNEELERERSAFAAWAQRDTNVFDTPIAEYGSKDLGRHSYTKGAWSLYVLYTLVGEGQFDSIIRTMLSSFASRPISFEQFQNLCERVTHRSLKTFFDEWIYGTASSQLLVDKVPIDVIRRRY